MLTLLSLISVIGADVRLDTVSSFECFVTKSTHVTRSVKMSLYVLLHILFKLVCVTAVNTNKVPLHVPLVQGIKRFAISWVPN